MHKIIRDAVLAIFACIRLPTCLRMDLTLTRSDCFYSPTEANFYVHKGIILRSLI